MKESKANMLFIVGAARSGTSLLQSFLDGHSEITSFPIESKLFWYSDYASLFKLAQVPKASKPKQISEYFLHSHYSAYLFNRKPKAVDYLDGVLFKEAFRQGAQDANQPLDLFPVLFKSLAIARKNEKLLERAYWLEKTPYTEEQAVLLKTKFPRARFIHVVRSPYANLSSLKGFSNWYSKKEVFPALFNSISNLKNSHYFLEYNQRIINSVDYKVVHYEDLVQNTQDTLKEIYKWLEIAYEPTLEKPTRLGVRYSGHSSYQKKLNKTVGDIAPEVAERWKAKISDLEIYLVNKYLTDVVSSLNYKVFQPKASWPKLLLPQRGEFWKAYLINRLALVLRLL